MVEFFEDPATALCSIGPELKEVPVGSTLRLSFKTGNNVIGYLIDANVTYIADDGGRIEVGYVLHGVEVTSSVPKCKTCNNRPLRLDLFKQDRGAYRYTTSCGGYDGCLDNMIIPCQAA